MKKKITPISPITFPNPVNIAPIKLYEATPGDTYFWLSSELANDETSSDEEMIKFFMSEGGLTEKQARGAVAERRKFEGFDMSYHDGAKILEGLGIENKKLI